MKLFIKK